ncbi:hypothetical protein [Sphingobium sp. Ant17]|uniref:hypothetical protein n=1 Tax=Sphingobium sp. Ant17 TaxID=1461752 RepID=UPI0004B0A549|nr:hypothetical protein [Sphingobium sp. Ant17]
MRWSLQGAGWRNFSDYMIDADISSGKLVPLLADKLRTPALQVSALYSEQASRLGRMKVFLDWLSDVTVDMFTGRSTAI